MKKMLLPFSLLFLSCSSYFVPAGVSGRLDNNDSKPFAIADLKKNTIEELFEGEVYDVRDYESYVFEMCESAGHDLDNFDQTEILAFPRYGKCNDENNKVVEMTYLYLPKDGNGPAFYIATLSHKNLYSDCGTFNCAFFENKIFIEDLDFMYAGKINKEDNTILFYNEKQEGKKHFSKWEFDTLSGDDLLLNRVTLTGSRFNPKPQVAIESVFSIPVSFHKTPTTSYYGKSLYAEECYANCGIDAPKEVQTPLMGKPVLFLNINDEKISFIAVSEEGRYETYDFKRKRVKLYWKPNENTSKSFFR